MNRTHKLNRFMDARGWSLNDIYSMFDLDEFQVNFSILNPDVIKAWHRHKNQDDYFCVVKGMAQIGTYSDKDGPEKYFIGEHNPAIVKIPAGEWHGLKALGNEPCGLLYFVTNLFDLENPDEERAGPFDFVESTWWEPECK